MKAILIHKLNLLDGNPLRLYPELQTIWSKESTQIALEAFDEEIIEMQDFPDRDYGGILLIKNEKNKVVGLTGYFIYVEGFTNEIWLRWHGVIPEFRNLGISPMLINFIKETIRLMYPNVETLCEYMPVSLPNSPAIANHFEKLGFEKFGEPEDVDFSPHQYQKYKFYF
jgi:GNAT superfamily N-acetyltransferase